MDEAQLADHDKLVAERDKANADKGAIEDRLQAAQAAIAQRDAEIKRRIDPAEFEQVRQTALLWQQAAQKYEAELQRLTAPPQILNTPVSEGFFDSGPWCPWQSLHGPCFNLEISEYESSYVLNVRSDVLNRVLYTNSDRNRASFFYNGRYHEFRVKQVRSQYPVQVEVLAKQVQISR